MTVSSALLYMQHNTIPMCTATAIHINIRARAVLSLMYYTAR